MSFYEPFDDVLMDEEPLAEGEIVLFGPSRALALEVVAVRGDKAWVRDLDDGRHGVLDVSEFRRLRFAGSGTLQ